MAQDHASSRNTPQLIAYLRVSTDEQAVSGAGLKAQHAAIDRAAEYEGLALLDVVVDEGQSGSTLLRPGLQGALERIAAGEAQGLVVAKLDRLSRSVVDFGDLLEWLEAAGASLYALDLKLDTSVPTGAMIAKILMVVAEWERETIAERTRAALAAKRAAGEPIGRAAVADVDGLGELIRALRSQEFSLQEIADRLNADGIATLRGAEMWRKSAVQSALGYQRPRARRRRAQLPDLPRRRVSAGSYAGSPRT